MKEEVIGAMDAETVTIKRQGALATFGNHLEAIEFGEAKNVLHHNVDIRLALADFDDERVGIFPPWVGLNAWRPPQVGTAFAADVGQSAQHGILAFAVELQVFFFPDAHADDARRRTGRVLESKESKPFIRLKTHFPVNKHLFGRAARFLGVGLDRQLR